MAFRDESGDN